MLSIAHQNKLILLIIIIILINDCIAQLKRYNLAAEVICFNVLSVTRSTEQHDQQSVIRK